MNKKLKAKWLRALRSGLYRRGRGALANSAGTKFCCLGVLADIQGCTWSTGHYGVDLIPTLPRARKPMVGSSHDILPPGKAGGLDWDTQNELIRLNDECGWSFKRVAAWVEKNV